MPEESSESPEVRTIRQLVRLMQRYDLTAIDLGDGPNKIRLRRRGDESAPPPAQPGPYVPPPVAAPLSIPATPGDSGPMVTTPSETFIESPMVGTFYASPSPDAPAFVSTGTAVRADTTVGIIEAMKVFTDIPAAIAGKIVECLVKSGQPVEFGQPLYRIEPA